jgi:hypothetical protein
LEKKDFTKEEMKTLEEAALVLEKLTYDIMLNHFKLAVETEPTELNKNIYRLLAKRESWEFIRDIQAQNRLKKRYFR